MTDTSKRPVDCPLCGTELDTRMVDFQPDDGRPGAHQGEFVDICLNPDCPGNESDLAPLAATE